MKFATYRTTEGEHLGLVSGDRIVDLASAAAGAGLSADWFSSMLSLIEGGDAALAAVSGMAGSTELARYSQPLVDVRLLAPLPLPPQIRDFTVFQLHAVQAPAGMRRLAAQLEGLPLPPIEPGPLPQVYRDRPIYYISNRFSVSGPGDEILWPSYSKVMDFELEFAAILGRKVRDATLAEAEEAIFGYTLFNDFSARDMQMGEMAGMLGPAKGKSFDLGNAFGPWIVTRDELTSAFPLKMRARVNGETWAEGDTSGMLHSFAQIIAYVSQSETLYPGEILGSGTMDNGCGLEQGRFLKDGDLIEIEVDGIGTLANTVHQPS